MPLGSLDRTPPPFFKQGPSALTRLAFFAALALFLMAADTRLNLTGPLRATIAMGLYPFERVLLAPISAAQDLSTYFTDMHEAQQAREHAEKRLAAQSERAMRMEQLEIENIRLRELLALRPRLQVRAHTAEVLYDSPDPYSRKVMIDQGSHHGIIPGSPVIDEVGLIGQVVRVYPLNSEVVLINDKDAAIPVLNIRTQQRSIAFGHPSNSGLELRYVAPNADIQLGDVLHTSGIDGVYPAGLPVGQIVRIDKRSDASFAQVLVRTIARPDSVRQVLILDPLTEQRAEPLDAAAMSHADTASAKASTDKASAASNPMPSRQTGAHR